MNIFTFIKNNVSIFDVISEYATLKKAGLYWKGVCPFHHEKTASFTVSPHKEIFYCFGCHSGGDVVAFISKAEQCSAIEAAYYLAERYSLQIPESIQHKVKDVELTNLQKKNYWKLCYYTALWCRDQLQKNSLALQYVLDRKLEKGIIDLFQLGYMPEGLESIQSFIKFMQGKGILLQDLCEANILKEAKNVFYSPLGDRILFPIKDHLGRLCGFGGRIYKQNDERPKYYNCKEHAFFTKGTLLFGFDLAKKNIQQTGLVFLVEGYMDCLAMVQHGFENTVATLGTACTLEQLKMLSRYAQEVYVMYDGDTAGQKAMLRLTELCWQVNLDLRIIQLPAGQDPDSFLSRGQNLKNLIDQAQDIFLFFIESSSKGFTNSNLQEKITTMRSLIEVIAKLDDNLKKEFLLQRASKAFDVPLPVLLKEMSVENSLSEKRGLKQGNSLLKEKEEKSPSDRVLCDIGILEKKLFSVIIMNINAIEKDDQEYLLEYFSPHLQDLFKKIVKIKQENPDFELINFFDFLEENERLLISQLVVECQEYEGPENIDYLLTQFQKKNWKSFVANTKIKLGRASQSQQQLDVENILKHFQEIKKKLLRRGLI